MKLIRKICLSAGTIALLSSSAFATDGTFRLQDNSSEDDTGFYLGIGISRVKAEASASYDNLSLDFDDTESTYNLRAGYMFSNWFGIEAAYYDFGKLEDTIQTLVAELTNISVDASLDLKGYGFSVIGNLPLKYVDLYVKGGVVKIDGKIEASALNVSASAEEDSTEPFAAIGAEADFGKINFFGEYSRILDNDDVEVDFVSAGVKFEF